jgi:hypothetical protein
MGFVANLWQFKARKDFRLAPLAVVLLLFGVLALFAPPTLAAFIYPLF